MVTEAPARILDFTEVVEQLKRARGAINKQLASAAGDYAGLSINSTLFFLLEVEDSTTPGAFLGIEAHALAFDYHGIRAVLRLGSEVELRAAWLISDACRSPLDVGQPARCVRCLQHCEAGSWCPHEPITIQHVPLNGLADAIVAWVKGELPAGAMRTQSKRP